MKMKNWSERALEILSIIVQAAKKFGKKKTNLTGLTAMSLIKSFLNGVRRAKEDSFYAILLHGRTARFIRECFFLQGFQATKNTNT